MSGCAHMSIVSADGRTWRCVGCGQEMVVSVTSRATWAEMGRRLQRRAPSLPSPAGQTRMALR